ncbi:hypothetical protein NFI00_000100 [Salmonella enterica]|nr:hypothetical protein [Salmonella enterica subsp. enterica serovar Minnesota]EJI5696397.1 hypothetical protein [Salmonella enterica]
MTNQRWGSLFVPLEGMMDYGYFEIVGHIVSDRIVSVVTGCPFVDHVAVYVRNFCQVPDQYVNNNAVEEFYQAVESEIRTLFNYNESLPGYLHAMDVLSVYTGRDFCITDMHERGITVLVEVI